MSSKAFKRIFSYIKKYRARFILSVLAVIIGTGFTIIAPTLLGYITTTLSNGVSDGLWDTTAGVSSDYACYVFGTEVNKLQYIIFILAVLVILYVASLIFCGFANNNFARITALVIKDMRTDIEC